MQYDGFLSYATASDYQTARRIESFLESFHGFAPASTIRRLQICRDGSDFQLPKGANLDAANEDPIWDIILAELQKARYLLVLCSPASAKSPWVAKEVAWFIEHRGAESVFALVTAAADPIHNPQECFPQELIAAGIHSSRIWYDLRGYRARARVSGGRDYEDELVRLTSDLLDWDALTLGPLSTLWQREKLKARRRQATLAIGIAAVLIVLAGLAIWKALQANQEALRAHISSLVTAADSQRDPLTSGLILNEAAALAGNSAPYGATNVAARVARSIRPLAVLHAHEGAVVSVVFNHQGDKVLTASQDGSAKIWPVDLKSPPTVFLGSGARLSEATFSHDDRRVVTAGADGAARIWNADGTGTPVVLQGHEQAVRTARFSPDDSRVVTASNDATARLWNAAGGPSLAVFREHHAPVTSAVFNSRGDLIATASEDGASKVWSINGAIQATGLAFPNQLKFSSAVFSPDDQDILLASSEGTGWIWSPMHGSLFMTLVGGSGPLSSAVFSPDGQWIVTSQFEEIQLWDVSQLRFLSRTNKSDITLNAGNPVRKAIFSPDSTRVAAVMEDGSARVWTIDGSSKPLVLCCHEGAVLDVAFSPDGTRIATASSDSTVRIWKVASSEEPIVADVHRGPIAAVELDSNGGRLLTQTHDGTVWSWKREGDRFVQTSHPSAPIAFGSLSSPGSRVVTVGRDGTVNILDADKLQSFSKLPVNDSQIRIATLSNSGAELLTVSGNNSLQLWPEAKTVALLRNVEGMMNSVRFSPDGARLVTTWSDNSVRVGRIDGAGDPLVFRGHQAAVTDAWFSPDGRYVVSVSADSTARVWDTTGKTQPQLLAAHPGPVYSAAFNMDGTKVITGSVGQARVWTIDSLDVPLELNVAGDDILAVAFNSAGTEAITATKGGRLWIWHTDWHWLASDISQSTQACLTSDQRLRLLGETRPIAEAQYRKCQASIRATR